MISFVISVAINAAVIWLIQWLFDGFVVNGGLKEFLLSGAFLALLNLLAKPMLRLITAPLIIITLGLFLIVINAFLLWLTDYLFPFIEIESISVLLGATVILGIINTLASGLRKIAA